MLNCEWATYVGNVIRFIIIAISPAAIVGSPVAVSGYHARKGVGDSHMKVTGVSVVPFRG